MYVKQITDTTCFRTDTTDYNNLRIAAELASCGANVSALAQQFCLKKSPARMMMESALLKNFHYTCDTRILGTYYTYDNLLQAGITDSELEGINMVVD